MFGEVRLQSEDNSKKCLVNAWEYIKTLIININIISLYSRNHKCTISGNRRLDTFVLSVGDSEDRHNHRTCVVHNAWVSLSGTVEQTCNAVARYLSFRRNGGFELYATALCEVVVIGHIYIGKLKW